MSDEPGKKGFFARINDALYEKVETGEEESASEREPVTGREPTAAAPEEDLSMDSAPALVTRVRADIEARGQALTQFLALVESFAEIIPEESGRYRAAMKALEKTGNLTRAAVLQASRDQLLALQSQREVFAEAVSRKREALKTQGGGVETIRAQIVELQQTIARLQEQEQALLRAAAAEEGKIKTAEEGFSALLTTMEGEIIASQGKIEKYVPG